MCELYQTSKLNISEHIRHIFQEGELEENLVIRKFRTTAADGKNYNTIHYNLDMIISLGYRVKSKIATNFRRWATERLKEYNIIYFLIYKGFEWRKLCMDQKFYDEIKDILNTARNKVYQTANFAMVEAYWNIGKSIIEEQGGNEKAEYGTGLLKELSKQMTRDFGKGFTVANLKNMRQFYLTFPNGYALRSELSWTHYRLLMRVENDNAREFYMQEAVKSQWSTRQLERQINSFFYERLLSSKNKEQVAAEIQTLEVARTPEDIIRDPYVLEFLGLNPNDDFYESDLEQALITHLQKFLLELGRGFSFVARQKRITFDGRHFRIDLVFYNYILKCFVLIDLKVGDLTHQALGQMQMYVHYYERELMNEGDNPPIGIVLCADKSESVVKYTLPENETQIFASKYKLYLPSEEELLRELNQEYQALEASKAGEEDIDGMKKE